MSDSVKVDVSRAQLKVVRVIDGLDPVARKRLSTFGAMTVLKAKRNASGGIVGKYKNGRKSGQLHRNISFRLAKTDGGVSGVAIGTGPEVGGKEEVKYASILEHGGTIKPKNSKLLAIPLTRDGLRPRQYFNTFFFRSGGKLFLAQSILRFASGSGKGKNAGMRLLFVLKNKVTMPAFHWLSRSIDLELLDGLLDPGLMVDDLLGGMRED